MRLGKFKVSLELINDSIDTVINMMRQLGVVVVKTDFFYDTEIENPHPFQPNAIEYTGFSYEFDDVENNADIPFYIIHMKNDKFYAKKKE